MTNKKILFYLAFVFSFSFTTLYAQSTQDLLNKARKNGMSDEQIKQKAAEMGYSVDDYMKLQAVQQKQAENLNQLRVRSGIDTTVIAPKNLKDKTIYPVPAFENRGKEVIGLQPFGYNIFNYSPTTFQPSINIPVPSDYLIGPGDEVIISLWGETQFVHNLTVAQDGNIYIPDVGLVQVSGLTMKALRTKLLSVLSKSYSSLGSKGSSGAKTHLDVTTGKLRSVKVFVLGEVNKPGGYTLPALSTSFTALYYSGGPNLDGSLRNVQVIRGGKVISTIDIYDYLLKGDQSSDVRLEDEDVLFVPPVGERVAISGHVFRPAIYELKKGDELKDLLKYAGGVNFTTYFQSVHLERVIPFDQRKDYQNNILSVDLNFKTINEFKNSNYKLSDGDVVTIKGISELPENRVTIVGDVKKPGAYELTGNMTVRDLIFKADTLFADAFQEKALIIRTAPDNRQSILNFNVRKAMHGDPADNFKLANRDTVKIFKNITFSAQKYVEIYGQVRNPGQYKTYSGMTVSDLIALAGGLTDSATTKNIEVTRLDTADELTYSTKISVSLPKDYWNADKGKDIALEDYDKIFVQTNPYVRYTRNIYVNGEVTYPGAYSILYDGEKVTDFIKRAGNFKSTAYEEGIYVYRKNPLFHEIDTDTTGLPDSTKAKLMSGSVYNRAGLLRKYSERIPIQWNEILQDTNSIYNLVLQPGDSLVVPKDLKEVFVLGAVGIPSTVPYKKGADLDYYISQAGGYTENASQGDDIVIQPNGKKWKKSGWFFIPSDEILSGATIVVPTKIQTASEVWPTIRDIVSVVSSTAVLILTIKNLSK